jgi:hypothetical protein
MSAPVLIETVPLAHMPVLALIDALEFAQDALGRETILAELRRCVSWSTVARRAVALYSRVTP